MPRREHQLKIGVSGIRGVVGEFLTPLLTREFAQAFGTYVGAGRVVVGRDTRATGPMLQHAVHCGLLASGCEVIDVGVLPTPTIQMFAGATKARGGIALTASHNPPEYNALKLFNNRGLFFNHYERNELLDIFHESSFRQASFDEMRPLRCDYDTAPRMHISRVLKLVDVERIRARKFRVALDAVNGAGSVMTPGFLTSNLGCTLDAIAIDPTKPFPREAEPKPETLGDLADLVRKSGSAIGFAQDPDGDRLAVCDENGNVLDNDDVFGLCLDAVLLRTPGNVVVNLMTSAVVDDIAAQHGCRVYRSPVGEANVVEFMQAVNAVVGGEGSNGGLILPAVHHCRDSYTAMALLLDRMAATGLPISELAAKLPRYYRFMDKVTFEHGKLGPMMQALEELYPEATLDRSDGLKLLLPDAWVHVRSSNTEPILRLAIETKSPERLSEIRTAAERILR
ncbi:MAG: phosphoglucosamine mutase [Acidobacteria bacterium]|nr:phosphoglucosamine mutase [Acidobacteriota bacterium]